ncbi:threonine/homoserine/homoserine lactone efflux protein [Bradyrhizobium sp. AZCC 1614]
MNSTNFTLFLLAALVIAAAPGPGIFYVAARTLSGGKSAGIASTFGTALGGLVHVIAGGLGVSALILASAELFTALKFAGAIYLVWLGIKTFREARDLLPQQAIAVGTQRAFREGVLVEALNPKTAAFFLAFIPQFLDPAGSYPALQFMALGLISVALNTLVDIIVVMMAATARGSLTHRPNVLQRLRQGSGLAFHRGPRHFAGAGTAAQFVGWVERSDTHQFMPFAPADGYRGVYHRAAEGRTRWLHPSYKGISNSAFPHAPTIRGDCAGSALPRVRLRRCSRRSQSRWRRSRTSVPARRRWSR